MATVISGNFWPLLFVAGSDGPSRGSVGLRRRGGGSGPAGGRRQGRAPGGATLPVERRLFWMPVTCADGDVDDVDVVVIRW